MATIEEVQEAARLWDAEQNRLKAKNRRTGRVNYTKRAAARIAINQHPVTRRPLLGSETCGTCGLAVKYGGHARDYWKCSSEGGKFATSSEATDIRLKWPACLSWQPTSDMAPGMTTDELLDT